MLDILNGWRRKAACVLIVISIGIMSLWMRSYVYFDGVGFGVGGTQHRLWLMFGTLYWSAKTEDPQCYWESFDVIARFPQIIQNIEVPEGSGAQVVVPIPCCSAVFVTTIVAAGLFFWPIRFRHEGHISACRS